MNQGAFLMRGLEKVRGEFSLTALAYNVRRVLNIRLSRADGGGAGLSMSRLLQLTSPGGSPRSGMPASAPRSTRLPTSSWPGRSKVRPWRAGRCGWRSVLACARQRSHWPGNSLWFYIECWPTVVRSSPARQLPKH